MIESISTYRLAFLGTLCLGAVFGYQSHRLTSSPVESVPEATVLEGTMLAPSSRLEPAVRVAKEKVGSRHSEAERQGYRLDDVLNLLITGATQSGPELGKSKSPREILKENPEIAIELLDMLSEISDRPLRSAVRMQLTTAIFMGKPAIEEYMLNKVMTDEADLSWWGLFAESPPQSVKGIEFFNDQLSFQSDPRKLQASARVLSNLRPFSLELISPETRKSIQEKFKVLISHHDEYVRAAAIGSLQIFNMGDTEELVLAALTDQSLAVRTKALNVYGNQLPSSERLSNRLLIAANDASLGDMERHSIAAVLSKSNSPHIDLAAVNKLANQLNSEIQELPEEVRLEMYRSYYEKVDPEIR